MSREEFFDEATRAAYSEPDLRRPVKDLGSSSVGTDVTVPTRLG